MSDKTAKYEAIVIGASAGGFHTVGFILGRLPKNFNLPVIIVQHRNAELGNLLEELMMSKCSLEVKQAGEKEKIQNGVVYFAPTNYHLLIESDRTFALTTDERINFSRPSIDVLFETAANTYRKKLIGIILTGSSNDGADGIIHIRKSGGLTVAQDPDEAQFSYMPQAAIDTKQVQMVLKMNEIAALITSKI